MMDELRRTGAVSSSGTYMSMEGGRKVERPFIPDFMGEVEPKEAVDQYESFVKNRGWKPENLGAENIMVQPDVMYFRGNCGRVWVIQIIMVLLLEVEKQH